MADSNVSGMAVSKNLLGGCFGKRVFPQETFTSCKRNHGMKLKIEIRFLALHTVSGVKFSGFEAVVHNPNLSLTKDPTTPSSCLKLPLTTRSGIQKEKRNFMA